MPKELIIAICIALFIILLPLYNLRSLIRSHSMAKIAREFGLSFSKGTYLLNPFEIYRNKTNVISGSIKGHIIEAYDYQQIGLGHTMCRTWVVILDGKDQSQPETGISIRTGQRTPLNKIRAYLSSL